MVPRVAEKAQKEVGNVALQWATWRGNVTKQSNVATKEERYRKRQRTVTLPTPVCVCLCANWKHETFYNAQTWGY